MSPALTSFLDYRQTYVMLTGHPHFEVPHALAFMALPQVLLTDSDIHQDEGHHIHPVFQARNVTLYIWYLPPSHPHGLSPPSLHQPLLNAGDGTPVHSQPTVHFPHPHHPALVTHYHLSLRSLHLSQPRTQTSVHCLPFDQSGLHRVKIESRRLPV